MAFINGNRVWETTNTTGTAQLALAGAKDANFTTFAEGVGVGNTCHYFIIWLSGYEYGVGTVTTSGILDRTIVYGNSNGTTSKVALPSGEKDIFTSILGTHVAMLDQDQKRLGPLNMNQQRLKFDDNQTAYMVSAEDYKVSLWLAAKEVFKFDGSGVAALRHNADFGGVGGNPFYEFSRSQTPSAGWILGQTTYTGNNTAGTRKIYAHTLGGVNAQTAGSEEGYWTVEVIIAGTLTTTIKNSGGSTSIIAPGKTPLIVNRNTNDGQLVSFRQGGTEQGGISVAGATVTYGTFTGVHWSEWAEGTRPEVEELGYVVISSNERYGSEKDTLCCVEPAAQAGDPKVYGVLLARENHVSREYGPTRTRLLVGALGTGVVICRGPVMRGDLLQASDEPGVAIVQDDDVKRSLTIGKVTCDDDRAGRRLVYATIDCG